MSTGVGPAGVLWGDRQDELCTQEAGQVVALEVVPALPAAHGQLDEAQGAPSARTCQLPSLHAFGESVAVFY